MKSYPFYHLRSDEIRLLNELTYFVEKEIAMEHSLAHIRAEVEKRIERSIDNNSSFEDDNDLSAYVALTQYMAGYIDAHAAMAVSV